MPIKNLGSVAQLGRPAEPKQEQRKTMKVLLIGDSTNMPSGFGGQMRIVAEGLAAKGHNTVVLTSSSATREDCPENMQEWSIANVKDFNATDRLIHRFAPDAVIVFWYMHMVVQMTQLRSAPANCPMFFWLPWEGSSLPAQADIAFRQVPKNRVVHLSEFARELWKPHVDSEVVIPHAYHPDFDIEIPADKSELRRKWAQRLKFPLFDDSVLILNVDRNVRHKRWDATFDYLKRLIKAVPDRPVQMIAHTKMTDNATDGTVLQSFDMNHLVKKYDVQERVAFTGFDWSKPITRKELAELYALSDFRITTSEGEGFGIPTIEAAVCGCPQVVNNHTTMPELLGETDFLVDPAMTEIHWDALFQVPNVKMMVERTVSLLNDPDRVRQQVSSTRRRVKERFSPQVVVDQWDKLIQAEDPNKPWFDFRWGYQAYYANKVTFRDLAVTLSKFKSDLRVFEVGAFDGMFTDFAVSVGLNYQGLEWEADAIKNASPLAQMHIAHADIKTSWMNADAIVLTDALERLYQLGEAVLFEVLEKCAQYGWLFIRFNPSFRWGVPLVDASSIGVYLTSKEMTRRHDLEMMSTSFAPAMSHQIWQKGTDTSHVPPEIAKASKK